MWELHAQQIIEEFEKISSVVNGTLQEKKKKVKLHYSTHKKTNVRRSLYRSTGILIDLIIGVR